MKKRKILVLFPLVGLLLTGCDFNETFTKVKDWVSENIYHPVKDFIDGKTGEDEKEKEDEGGKEEEKTVKRILVESYPESVAQNGTIAASSVSVRVFYSDNTEEVKPAEKVTIDTSTPGDNVPMTVEFGGKTDTVTVKVIAESEVVHVGSISFSVATRNLHVGETAEISITVTPDNATDQTCTFASSDEDVLSVTQTGLVTAKAVGKATVTVTSNDNAQATKSIEFTVLETGATLPGSTKAGYTKLATGETLKNGEKINIVGAIGSTFYVMPNYSAGNNIKAKTVNTEDGKLIVEDIVEDEATSIVEFTVVDSGEGTIALMQADGKHYLSACGDSAGKNYLKVTDKLDSTAKFSYSVDENGNAQLQAKGVERGYLCLNPNTQYGDPLYACYKSSDGYEKYAVYHDGKGSSEHVSVEGIQFGAESYSVEEGATVELSVNVLPSLASDKGYSLEIQSAEPAGCVTLSGNKVTGNAVGSAVILAKSNENEQITATTTVTVFEKVERNYGTLENPLSIAEAKALIDLDGGTAKQTIYITGKVSKNDAYNSSYKNTIVWLSDGTNDFELYGALMPEGFTPAQPVKNDAALVGKVVVAHGMGKIYGSTYEFDKNCQIDSVKDDIVAVESVTLSEQALNLEVGQQAALTATVLPENASNKEVKWEVKSEGETEVAKYEDGKVVALAAGSATVTATSAADSTKFASCSVTVSEPTKELQSISISGQPEKLEYYDREAYDAKGLKVMAHYNIGDDEDVTANATITAEHEKAVFGDKSIKFTATYGSQSAEASFDVSILSSLERAYKGAMAESTDTFTFAGTVVSITGKSYVLQNGSYAINVYNYQTADVALNKLVEVVSTMKLQNGCPQTNSITSAAVIGEGTAQTSSAVASKADLDALNHNVLAHVADAVFVSKTGDWASNASKQFIFKIGEDDITVQFDKYGYDADKAAIANAAVAGAHYELSGLVTAAYSGNNQFTFTGTSGITKTQDAPIPDPSSVTITCGDSVAVDSTLKLTATVLPENASQEVEWSIVEGGSFATLADDVLTGVATGNVKVRATAKGFENIYAEKTIEVTDGGTPVVVQPYSQSFGSNNNGYMNSSNTAYASVYDVTLGDIAWKIPGNQNLAYGLKLGGKLSAETTRSMITQTKFANAISSVVVTTGTKDTQISVTKCCVEIYSSAADAASRKNMVEEVVATYVDAGTITFAKPAESNWSNVFFAISFSMTSTATTSNKGVVVTNVTVNFN